jgi:hypothetical protein
MDPHVCKLTNRRSATFNLWAWKHRWTNPTTDILVCDHCNVALAIKLHPGLKPADKHRIAQGYRCKLCSVHKLTCPFHSNNFPPTTSDLPVWMASVVPDNLLQLMDSPTANTVMTKLIKALDLNSDGTDFAQFEWTYSGEERTLLAEVLQMFSVDKTSVRSLALFGWESDTPIQDAAIIKVRCSVCLVEVELDCSDHEVRNTEHEPACKRKKRGMDPINSHRYYCPWKCGFPVDSTPVLPLWQVIAKRLVEELPEQQDLDPVNRFEAIQMMLSSAISSRIVEPK